MPTNNLFEGSEQFDKAIAAAFAKVKSRLTPNDILRALPAGELAQMVERIGKNMWVVISADGKSVAKDPATGYAFKHNNKKFAEMVAKELGGHAVLFADALKTITDSNRPS